MKKSELLKQERKIILIQVLLSLTMTGIACADIHSNKKQNEAFVDDVKKLATYVQDEDDETINRMLETGKRKLRSDNVCTVLYTLGLNAGPIALSYISVRDLEFEYEREQKELKRRSI